MGFAGFGGAPVYVVLPSPGGGMVPSADPAGPQLQEILRNLPYTPSSRGVTIYELPEGSTQKTTRVSSGGLADLLHNSRYNSLLHMSFLSLSLSPSGA